MSDQEKKQQRIYELLNAKTKPKFLCLLYIEERIFFFFFFLHKRNFLRKKESGGLKKNNEKEGFVTVLSTAIKKDMTTSIRKHANELKIHENIKNMIKNPWIEG